MRLGISRHRRARLAAAPTARGLAAVAGGSLLVIALSGTAGAGVSGPLGAGGPPHYVALGDSYTAGPLIPDQTGSPAGCLRSTHSYPFLVAAGTGAATFTDVSCQGATTADMTHAQSVPLGTNPPQDNALSASTTLVTLQIGGNDIGFSDIIIHCTTLSLTEPVRLAVQGPLHLGRHRPAPGGDQRGGPEGRRGPAGDPRRRAERAGAPGRVPGDPAQQRRRLLAAGADRLRRRALPARRGEGAELDARHRGRREQRDVRGHLHREHRPRRVPGPRDQVGRGPHPHLARGAVPPQRARRAGDGPAGARRQG